MSDSLEAPKIKEEPGNSHFDTIYLSKGRQSIFKEKCLFEKIKIIKMNVFFMIKSFPFFMIKHLLYHLLKSYYSVLQMKSDLI